MEVVVIGFIIILNLISIIGLYRILGGIKIKNRIVITAVCLIAMYVILFILYSISSIGIDAVVSEGSRQVILLVFLPINIICIIYPFILQIMKLKEKDIDNEKIKKRLLLCLIIAIVVIIIDYNYMKSMQTGIGAEIERLEG